MILISFMSVDDEGTIKKALGASKKSRCVVCDRILVDGKCPNGHTQ